MNYINEYLNSLGIKSGISGLSDFEVKELLKLVVKDFKEEKISLNELTDICESIWSEVYHQNKISGDSINLVSAGLDLQYYLRKVEDNESANIFISNLRTLLNLT